MVAAARHRNYNIESRIPHEFSVDTLVHTWSPRFVPFWDPEEWPPYDGPKYIADLAYRWNKRGLRKRMRHRMVMDQIPRRTIGTLLSCKELAWMSSLFRFVVGCPSSTQRP